MVTFIGLKITHFKKRFLEHHICTVFQSKNFHVTSLFIPLENFWSIGLQ